MRTTYSKEQFMKKLGIVIILLFIVYQNIVAQDCQQCKKRMVILYDNQVDVPRPTGNVPDSVYMYWDYFFLAGGVRSYLSNSDATKDCFRRLDGAFFTEDDTLTSSIKFGLEHANLPPSGEIGGDIDYIVYGVVSGSPTPTLTVKLETAMSRELVTSASVPLPQGFDPIATGQSAAAQICPLFTTIMDFEKNKRDGGDPYAIYPTITVTPAKKKLSLQEVTSVELSMKDCDDAELGNRTLQLEVEGGTLNVSTIALDGNGKATVQFTAGAAQTIADVRAYYIYTTPTGKHTSSEFGHGYMQINKPGNQWYASGTLEGEYRYMFNILSEKDSDGAKIQNKHIYSSIENKRISFAGWLTNLVSLPNYFAAVSSSFLRCFGRSAERSNEYILETASAGGAYSISRTTASTSISAVSNESSPPTLSFTVTPTHYDILLSSLPADQLGGSTTQYYSYVTGEGEKTSTDTYPCNPTTELSSSVQGASFDTTYSVIIDETNSHETDVVTQKCSWNDTTFTLTYMFTTDITKETPASGYTYYSNTEESHYTYKVKMYLSRDGESTNDVGNPNELIPYRFAVEQNYPNPFNPLTKISYQLPTGSHITLKVFNVLGREVATLVNEDKEAGYYDASFDASNLSSGVYFYKLQAGNFVMTKKMLLAR
jgi:hypothetical protein